MTRLLEFAFEGKPLTVVYYKGEPHWIAREVGAALDYAKSGKRLVTSITGKWPEFVRGEHFVVLEGDDLQLLKSLLRQGTESGPCRPHGSAAGPCRLLDSDAVHGRTARLMLLRESGLHLALLKADHRLSVRVRRYLAEEVMPQLARVGSYRPGRTVESNRVVEVEAASGPAREFERDPDAAAVLQQLFTQLWRSKRLDDTRLANLAVTAAEFKTGLDLSEFRPPSVPTTTTAIQGFLSECCAVGERTRTTELYAAYRRWVEREGLPALNNVHFGRELARRGLRSRNGGNARYYPIGLRAPVSVAGQLKGGNQ